MFIIKENFAFFDIFCLSRLYNFKFYSIYNVFIGGEARILVLRIVFGWMVFSEVGACFGGVRRVVGMVLIVIGVGYVLVFGNRG